MKNDEYSEIHLKDFVKYFPLISTDSLSDDFFISKVSNGMDLAGLADHPFRFDGYLACFCVEGQIHAEINLKHLELTAGSLLLYVPGHLLSLTSTEDLDTSRFVVVAIPQKILQNARVDFAKLYDQAISVLSNPCIRLKDEEVMILSSYYHLSEQLIHAAQPSLEDTMIDLGASLFHYLGSLWTERISSVQVSDKGSLRSQMIFEKFMKLVSDNHSTERGLNFYADKLNLSPKYLSQLVAKVSGQSAPEWISSFVILEAKNYLKYSDLDVKEIAYKLHFSSTPVFFRYFKAHTGLTPLEYRKS